MLDQYKAAFSKLRSDSSPSRWASVTNHRAPHKPFLLLSIMDLIAQGEITTNFFQFSAELMDTFDLYWIKVMGHDKESSPVLPFYHLKSDGFWHLVAVSSSPVSNKRTGSSRAAHGCRSPKVAPQ
jgi:predicted restriction endonuclease